MKLIGVVGTIAMFLVGGGIIVHGILLLHHWQLELNEVLNLGIGIFSGGPVMLGVNFFKKNPNLYNSQ
jgi:predicted DNA repair protein MutK